MDFVINTNNINIQLLPSKRELLKYLKDFEKFSILLGENTESEDLFYLIKVTSLKKIENTFYIGIIATNCGVNPNILPLINENRIVIGINKEIVFIDMNSKKIIRKVDLSSFFHRLIYIPNKSIILVASELGLYRVDIMGNTIWEFTRDVVEEYYINERTISIRFMDSSSVEIEIDTGFIAK